MDLQFQIKPRGINGLLFWSGEDLSSRKDGDFVAIAFWEGSLELRYNLGSGEAVVSLNHTKMFDGEWHKVRVQRLVF